MFLEDNIITEIEDGAFLGLTKLKYLYVYNNDFTEIRPEMWQGLQSLKHLSIGNKVTSLPDNAFLGLVNLKNLYMGYNKLQTIRREMWNGLHSLQKLHLCGNKIKSLGAESFVELPNLYFLLLNYNKLNTVREDAFVTFNSHPTDLSVALEGNPLQCDSELCWLKEAEERKWIELDYTSNRSPLNCVNYPRGEHWRDIALNCTAVELNP